MTVEKILETIRNIIVAEWPEAVAELGLDADAVFHRSDDSIIVSLEHADACSFLFGDQGFDVEFIDRIARLSDLVHEAGAGWFFEAETAGALVLVPNR